MGFLLLWLHLFSTPTTSIAPLTLQWLKALSAVLPAPTAKILSVHSSPCSFIQDAKWHNWQGLDRKKIVHLISVLYNRDSMSGFALKALCCGKRSIAGGTVWTSISYHMQKMQHGCVLLLPATAGAILSYFHKISANVLQLIRKCKLNSINHTCLAWLREQEARICSHDLQQSCWKGTSEQLFSPRSLPPPQLLTFIVTPQHPHPGSWCWLQSTDLDLYLYN